MQKEIKLKNIADVIAGYTFREAVKEDLESFLYVLQAKNIKNELILDDNSLVTSSVDTSHTKAFAKSGDVAIAIRGFFRSAVIISDKTILASSSVFLMRLKETNFILPEYLVLYLNSSCGQKELEKIATGAVIKLILKKDLENLTIPNVSIVKQKKIIDFYLNIKKQKLLMTRKIEIQKNIINGIFKRRMEK